jgi:hypothetical protein
MTGGFEPTGMVIDGFALQADGGEMLDGSLAHGPLRSLAAGPLTSWAQPYRHDLAVVWAPTLPLR